MAAMEKAAVTQNDWSEGKVVIAPVAKAQTSVSVVTVTEAPALLIVMPKVLARPCFFLGPNSVDKSLA